jgi:excinuclease ABC subunit C
MGGFMDGIEVIRARVAELPAAPGVYRMLNGRGEVLYVGKAKNLRHRVTQYTQPQRHGFGSERIRKMVFETRDLVVVESRSEAEALLLEANLIKSLKPRYNIIFRDDQSYVSVLITDEETPMLRSYRGSRGIKGEYFGPYPSAMAVYRTLDLMERVFRLRTCSAGFFRHRTRPCLKYDIKRCSAPCVNKIAPAAYQRSVAQAKRFLQGEREAVTADLKRQMAEASAALDYERAGELRDSLKAISAVSGLETGLSHALGEADVFALAQTGGHFAVQAFHYRHGQHVGNHTYFPEHTGAEAAPEVLRLFLAQHYASRPVPPEIFCNLAPAEAATLAEALGLHARRKVSVSVPQRGEKKEIVAQAAHNAQASLARKAAESDGWALQLTEFGRLLGVERPIQCIECFDISNLSGKQAVASLVTAGPEGMERRRYRRYAVSGKQTPDDYAMLAEVLERRIFRGLKEENLPDVLMVDGGKGQLNVLARVAEQAGILGQKGSPVLCAIAKGEERDKGLETLFALAENRQINELPINPGTPLIFMLQRIRDEAHRFAITYHRQKRSAAISHSKLDDIPGIGGKKKRDLLLHFGSVKEIEGATVHSLCQVTGISKRLAQKIYDFFHL